MKQQAHILGQWLALAAIWFLLVGGVTPAFAGKNYALLIAIDKYQAPGIRTLSYAESGATALAETLKSRYGYETQMLLGQGADRASLLREIDALNKLMTDQDTLLIYFAGQAGTLDTDPKTNERRAFLFLYDTTLSKEDRDRVVWSRQAVDLWTLLAQFPRPAQVLFLGDSCFGGRFEAPPAAFRPAAGDHADRAMRRARMVICAGTDGQRTIEATTAQRGLFTHMVLERLGQGEPLSATELFLNIQLKILEQSGRTLFPLRWSLPSGDGEFVFAGPGSDSAAARRAAGARLSERCPPATTMAQFYQALQEVDFRRALDAAQRESEWKVRSNTLHIAASLGDPLALASLVFCYNKGLGVAADDVGAYRWAVLAADTGHPAGLHVLARCLNNGVGVTRDAATAERLFRETAEAGFAASTYLLALDVLRSGVPGPRQKDALAKLESIKDSGLLNAMLLLAQCHSGRVKGIPRNIPEALRLLKQAVEQGNSEAEFTLYQLYTEGLPDSPPRDDELARKLLMNAANAGIRSAQFCLAAAYFQGPNYEQYALGLPPDLAKAREWAERAAGAGSPEACVLLSVMYAAGAGVPADIVKAKEFCEKALEQKYTGAFVQRGLYHLLGGVYAPDDTKAFSSFERAAEAGDAAGMYWLAYCYDELRGIKGVVVTDAVSREKQRPRFALQAIQWYVRAAQKGQAKAIEALKTKTWPPAVLEQLANVYPETLKEYRRISGK